MKLWLSAKDKLSKVIKVQWQFQKCSDVTFISLRRCVRRKPWNNSSWQFLPFLWPWTFTLTMRCSDTLEDQAWDCPKLFIPPYKTQHLQSTWLCGTFSWMEAPKRSTSGEARIFLNGLAFFVCAPVQVGSLEFGEFQLWTWLSTWSVSALPDRRNRDHAGSRCLHLGTLCVFLWEEISRFNLQTLMNTETEKKRTAFFEQWKVTCMRLKSSLTFPRLRTSVSCFVRARFIWRILQIVSESLHNQSLFGKSKAFLLCAVTQKSASKGSSHFHK